MCDECRIIEKTEVQNNTWLAALVRRPWIYHNAPPAARCIDAFKVKE